MQAITRDIPALNLRASFRPGSMNAEKRTVDVVWTTGAKVLRGFFDKFYEELSLNPKHVRLERLNGGAPLLNAHDDSSLTSVIGVVEPGSARLGKSEGIATVRFARAEDDPAADVIYRKVVDGIIQNVSVGYRVHTFEKTDNVENKIPTYRAVDWEPFEISFVPMGADAGAGARSTEAARVTPCAFITTLADADRLRRLRLAHAKAHTGVRVR